MNNGIDTFVRNLSFAEKRLVIVTAILNQTKESQNDWARTINCGFTWKQVLKNFVNLCKKGVNIFKYIFANDRGLLYK